MDLAALILACSLHPDDELVRVLIDVASQGNLYFVGDLRTLQTNDDLSSLDDAQLAVSRIERRRGRPAVGLMGVPITWAPRFGRTPADLFDACTNVAVATAVLSAHHRQCRERADRTRRGVRRSPQAVPPAAHRACILRGYGREMGIPRFADAVLGVLRRADVSIADRHGEAPEESPVFVGESLSGQAQP